MIADLVSTRQTLAWLALVAITLVSWAVGHSSATAGVGGAAVLVLAFAKAFIVVREFMEVRHAPRWLRLVTVAWIIGACTLLVALYATVQ